MCDKEMNECRIGRVEIHECRHCRGIWFNGGQFDAAKDEMLPDFGWMDFDIGKNKSEFKANTRTIFCPICHQMNLIRLYDPENGSSMDLCTQCKGIWLDADQFCMLIDRLVEQADQQSVPDYIRASLLQAKEMLVNPESIISEWHDLKSVLKLLNYRILAEHPAIERLISGLQNSIPA